MATSNILLHALLLLFISYLQNKILYAELCITDIAKQV